MGERWNAVAETATYSADAAAIFTEQERRAVVDMVALNPECGVVIQGTGGVRKVRVPLGNKSKRGGARVIYYFYNETGPVLLMAVFAKSEKSDLDKSDLKVMAEIAAAMKASIQRKGQ